jgi:peptidoglycan/xylan/chitin deacetylase (PgdA/CDA1 family)
MKTFIPVLLYHSVNDHAAAGERRWTVSPAEFASHVDAVGASGRTAMTITDIAGALRGERPLPSRPVAISFDDGYADTYDALTVLRARDLVATIYITTAEVGMTNRLSPRQLAEIAEDASVEVGAHAVRHRRLDELDDRAVAAEVRGSKAHLEDLLQASVRSFAYPHGAYDRAVRRAVVDAGYRSAAAVKNALSHDLDDPFAIARWTVTAGKPAARIAEVLDGEGVPVAWERDKLRTRAYRAARRGRRSIALTAGMRR